MSLPGFSARAILATVTLCALTFSAAAGATLSPHRAAVDPKAAGASKTTGTGLKAKAAPSASGAPHVYVTPFSSTPIVTKTYKYWPGPPNPGDAEGSVDPDAACTQSFDNCTDQQLCHLHGINCPADGASTHIADVEPNEGLGGT